jgi:cell division protein FtsL
MSNADNRRQNNDRGSNDTSSSIFQIMDRIMKELNKTRKVFVFMFFSMMILPVTTIIIFMYTFDDPKIDRGELLMNIQEFNFLSQKLKNQMIQLENLESLDKQKELQLLLNSEDYKQTINRIDELSQNELKLVTEEPKNNLHKKEIRLITFILSIIWIILGIRQYIILSSWGKRYNRFKKQQEEIDKKFDLE